MTRVLGHMIYGTNPLDPAVYGVVAGLILGVIATASYVPARRAAAVDPMIALRAD
jgi:ABC-type antimicrobial peptide transport system permease subunit